VPDLSPYAAQLRGLADALEAQSEPNDDPFTPHADTLEVINNRPPNADSWWRAPAVSSGRCWSPAASALHRIADLLRT
jgi:hypothetical protein